MTHCRHRSDRRHSARGHNSPENLDDDTLAFANAIFDSARQGDAQRLSALLVQGLPVNLTNYKGDTLLMLASYHGHLTTARILLDHGADPERHNDDGHSPLAGAAFKGDQQMVELLLDHGADPEYASPDGKRPLMFAAMFNRTTIVDILLARGADPAARDSNGMDAQALAKVMNAEDTLARLDSASP